MVKRLFGVKEVFGQHLGKIGLSHAGRAEEDERADGRVGILESRPVASDGLGDLADGVVLSDDRTRQLFLHLHQAKTFVLGDTLHRNARHHGDDFGDVLFGHWHPVREGVAVPFFLGFLQLLGEFHLVVAMLAGIFETLFGDGLFFLFPYGFDFFLKCGDLVRHVDVADVHPRTGFVEGVDGLVGKVTVRHVAVGELDAGVDGFGSIGHRVVLLVFRLDVVEDFHGLFRRGGIDEDLLETTFQSAVLFDVLPVFVEGGGADALQLASGQGRLEHVGGVKRPVGVAGPDKRMDLVDEQDDVRVLLQLVEDGLDALLELSAVFGACHNAADVKHHDAFVEQGAGDLVLDDTDGQSLRNGGFAYAGLTNEDGVVFLSATQDLGDALQLLVSAHNGIQPVFLCGFGQIATEVVEDRSLALDVAGLLGTFGLGLDFVFDVVVVAEDVLRGLCRWHLFGEVFPHGGVVFDQLILEIVVGNPLEFKVLRDDIVPFVQDGEHEVLRPYHFALEFLGDDIGELQHPFRLFGQWKVLGDRLGGAGNLDGGFKLLAEDLNVEVQVDQDLDGATAAIFQHAEEKMLQSDVGIAQSDSFAMTQ